jgi:hypothetical protein
MFVRRCALGGGDLKLRACRTIAQCSKEGAQEGVLIESESELDVEAVA